MIEETQRTIKIQSKSTSLSKTKSMKRSRRTPEYGTLLTMQDIPKKLLDTINHPSYRPLKPKALSRKVGLAKRYDEFKAALKELIKTGQVKLDKNHSIRPVGGDVKNAIPGIFRKTGSGIGFVRPSTVATTGAKPEEIFISEHAQLDASTGDTVLVKIGKHTPRGPRGEIVRVLERATRNFVGVYFERQGDGYVRVDGTVFAHSIYVGDPGAKGVKPDDKVVIDMVRFPSADDRGEGVIVEILGPRGDPGVDVLSIIRSLNLPDAFPEDVLAEARNLAHTFHEDNLEGREDFTDWQTITIDPVDARDFDDAVSLAIDPKSKHWQLGVHIADVGHFAPSGSALDREARKRATSIYLPGKVIPMFPEILSNGLASLQEGKVRFVKSVLMDLTPSGVLADVRFANAAIKVNQRFSYEQVSEILEKCETNTAEHLGTTPAILNQLKLMRDLALILHKRRVKRGSLQLNMPETQLEFDKDGKVCGAHFRKHDISHQMIEECMLAANEAAASHLNDKKIAFLRRIHPAPEPNKLRTFAEFARILGYKIKNENDRFSLQRVLDQSAEKPEAHAVHYALLRSLKQATYSPQKDDHYALASENYCHFTSPIRRYPDLVVHRLFDQLLKRGKAGSSMEELMVLGDHCSKMERRAELAERELTKHKLLVYMTGRIGEEMNAIITGVADYGFYAQAEDMPAEGLVHISNLPGDYYYFDEPSYSLVGQRFKRQFRLGDKVRVTVVRVDLARRQMDLRVVTKQEEPSRPKKEVPERRKRRKGE
jgi:ribonuclease R